MHILIANVYFAPYSYGGATVVAEAVAQALKARHGCRITAVSSMTRPELAPYTVMRAEAGGIQNHLINLPVERSYTERYDNAAVTEAMTGLIADLEPDLVHAHCLQELGAGVLGAARQAGLPAVLSMHDFWWICERQFMIRPSGQYCAQDPVRLAACRGCVDDIGRAGRRQEALRTAAAKADLITFPSRFAHDLTLASGIAARQAAVWANGVRAPGPGFFAAQAARRAADPRPVFGFVGGPSQIKGWPLIKAAFRGLGRHDFAGLAVDASLDGSWWAPADLAGLDGDWQIHPRFAQDAMDEFYAKIDVLLFPSQWKETFGLTVREAAARGIAVIQTDAGGAAEWDGVDAEALLQIGEGPETLRTRIRAVLEAPGTHPAPRPMAGFDDQAKAFLDLVAPLLA